MTYSFNLIDQPWIPCAMLDGSYTELSLNDTLLQAHKIREIFDQSPLVTAALHRLLLAILHRNFGPASGSEWQTLWQAKQFDSVQLGSYFSQWHDRFDLFDDKYPFYQVAGLEPQPKKVKEICVNDFLPELSQGNKPTLFDHTTNETSPVLNPSEAARAVIMIQSYKLGGLFVPRVSYVDAPLARLIYFLVGGNTLFETLLLNLVPYHGDNPFPVIGDDLPVWEQNTAETSGIPSGYLDYLTWQTISLRLIPTQPLHGNIKIRRAYVGLGRNKLEHGKGSCDDPGCSYRKNPKAKPDQDPWRATRYERGRALWRDSASLFRFIENDREKPLSALKWASDLIEEGVFVASPSYRLEAYGQCTRSGNDFVHFWRRDSLPLPSQYLTDEDLVEELEIALDNAEKVAWYLEQAMKIIARAVLGLPERDERKEVHDFLEHRNVPGGYWSVLEVPFLDCMRRLPNASEATLVWWHAYICAEAERVFSAATDGLFQSPQKMRAIMAGESFLRHQLRKLRTEAQQGGMSARSDPTEDA